MKYFFPLCLFLLCVTSCKQETFYEKIMVWPGDKNVASLDRNNGFKDLKLGLHISALSGLLEKESHSSSSDYAIYRVKPESLAKFNIEEVKVKAIETHFINNLLYRFRVELEGEENAFPFYVLLMEAYGGAYPEDTYPEAYEWNGNRVRLKYTVHPDRDATAEFTNTVVLKAVGMEYDEEKLRKAEEAASKAK